MTLAEAKTRLDRLINKSRAHLYKPIAIAEILYHNRTDGTPDLSDTSGYRRVSDRWCAEVYERLNRKPKKSSNARYWDQLFDPAVLPPAAMMTLGKYNRQNNGLVEMYVYARIRDRFAGILGIFNAVKACKPREFDLISFLRLFEGDCRFRRSVDKAYEIVVYALFNTITSHLKATVTLAVTPEGDILRDFAKFAKLVLGVDQNRMKISQPARLYRVGTTNAADAGLDMWANFGPAVQVKHVSLTLSNSDSFCGGTRADQMIIVCKKAEAKNIKAVLDNVGFGSRIRGVITEVELSQWYGIACGEKYHTTLGRDLLQAIVTELALEFPLIQEETVSAFMEERGYDTSRLTGMWVVQCENVEQSAEDIEE